MCAGTDLIRQEGMLVCQSCGAKYFDGGCVFVIDISIIKNKKRLALV
jgi:hypothetical protein